MHPDHFSAATLAENLRRLEALQPDTQPGWGKMNAPQMLAHLNVAYDMDRDFTPEDRPNRFARFMLRTFVKKAVVGPRPYPKNGRTAPAFLITDQRDFAAEKAKLIANLKRTVANGPDYYAGRENRSFGQLTTQEWSTLFQKHLDHHFTQFGL